ncbi:hypothetical protein CRE_04151 [Caenorhabditis remanei]|uniref:Sdz-33 F-box domain-containing protein n=1 Tax=Caenorhabditis remanei TaxID=31234 RepID=E3MYP8_CAERE|nr:hypothetical protein CRE_04151 [Caenorhabditis remanei]
MTTLFPLFSLPYVPFKQVLDNIGPQGIMILSLCSQRSKNVAITYSGASKDVKLQLMYCDNIGSLAYNSTDILEVIDIKELEDFIFPTLSNGHFRDVPYTMHEGCLVIFWEDTLTGLIEIGNYAREIFNRDINEINIGDFHFESESTSDEDLDYVLENVKCTGLLSLSAKPSENYRPAKPLVFNLDELKINFSFWIRLSDLLAMNSKTVRMRGSKLTSHDLNVFLKHWMAGGCSQLKDFFVDVEEAIDYEIVLDGVEFTERGDGVERVYVDKNRNPHTIRGGFDVKQSNVTATIVGQYRYTFWFIVW